MSATGAWWTWSRTRGEAIERELRAGDYGTKRRGERHEPAARPAGEGVYAISLEDGQMHLSYALELPDEPDEVQKAFRIGQVPLNSGSTGWRDLAIFNSRTISARP